MTVGTSNGSQDDIIILLVGEGNIFFRFWSKNEKNFVNFLQTASGKLH